MEIGERSWADVADEEDFSGECMEEFRVLDVACGRGGDLWKWAASVIESGKKLNYVGLDVDGTLLEEAQRRSTQVSRKHGDNVRYQFFRCDLRSEQDVARVEENLREFQVDVVSCQFALHYFFQTEESFATLFSLVTRRLKRGGLFIASMFDGEKVLDELRLGTFRKPGLGFTIEPAFDVEEQVPNVETTFGLPISVVLSGDDDVILKTATTEYLVLPDAFCKRL
jgi:mRNA (guanine-N7-)-methyltransferase